MQTKVIILVTDRDDDKHGEISVVEDLHKAERLVETLMEAGFERERIRVFSGGELGMQVSHRPMVSLVSEDDSGEEPEPDTEEPESEAVEAEAEEDETKGESEVRFSSLFPSA